MGGNNSKKVDERDILSEAGYSVLTSAHSEMLREHVLRCHNLKQTINVFQSSESMLDIWDVYVKWATPTTNVFVPMMINSTETIPFPPALRDYRRFTRHLQFIEDLMGSCLLCLIGRENYTEMVLILYALGEQHAQRGVTPEQLQYFFKSCTASVAEVNKSRGKYLSAFERRAMDGLFQFVMDVMMDGLRHHIYVMQYVTLLVEKNGSCWKRRQLKRKSVRDTAKNSWRKMANQLSK